MSYTLRSKETEERYTKHKENKPVDEKCVLCGVPSIKDFKYWRIVKNDFPYDLIATTHDMILPIRHVKESELTEEERLELLELKSDYLNIYDAILESTPRMKTVPSHHHLHVIVTKDIASSLSV